MRLILVLLIVLLAGPAVAAVPARIPLQGYLTNASGDPVNGSVQIEFRLYDVPSGGVASFTETQTATVQNGTLGVYLGANTTLDLATFRSNTRYLGVTIVGEAEMTPRIELGTVPYAAYAQETAAVPPGAVMMFDLEDCPPGWSVLDAARGRALVGVPTGGTRVGTVGAPLANLEDRLHGHSVDPAAITTSTDGAHSHAVDPAPVGTTSVDTSHAHGVGALTTTSSGAHRHPWSNWDAGTRRWVTWDVNGAVALLVDWAAGLDGTQPTINPTPALPLQYSGSVPNIDFHTDSGGTHTHGFGASAVTSSVTQVHQHIVDSPATTSSSAGAHGHTCDVATTSSSSNSAGMPYIQLLVCRKD